MNDPAARRRVLERFGATGATCDELLEYNHPDYAVAGTPGFSWPPAVPLPAEPHLVAWRAYEAEARAGGVWPVLRAKLYQLRFPIGAGMSQSPEYVSATRKGILPPADTPLPELEAPDRLQLRIHASPAGEIPVLTAGSRADFAFLVRALTKRNEPSTVPDSMGACMVAGLNNWDRISAHRRAWEQTAADRSDAAWAAEFASLTMHKELYQDRFIVLGTGGYSGIAAAELDLAAERWANLTATIRVEHECVHYLTKRVFGRMRTNALDELLADYAGISAALGRFRASWFLRFVGLEAFPDYREGGRLQNYKGNPPLSDPAFRVLCRLVHQAALNLERFAHERDHADPPAMVERTAELLAIAGFSLEALAEEASPVALRAALAEVRRHLGGG
ncbi:MAG: hypothetical protein HYV63_07465 [Candidatus Schekmanbacteria bacterium]|nr:hypothetical protein [Candidatus Schekmanbacteria bacterium]